jgi:hypothetical protein
MYTIRTIDDSGTESNKFLGKSYTVICVNDENVAYFNELFSSVYNFNFNPFEHETRCIVAGENNTHFMQSRESAYIMTDGGKTFSTINVPLYTHGELQKVRDAIEYDI